MDVEQERLELLEAIYNLASLIEHATDLGEILGYVDQLGELKAKLVALGPPPPKKIPAKNDRPCS
jgi:hypothetical protein